MGKTRDQWAENSKVFLVLELEYRRDRAGSEIAVIASVVGREAPAEKAWRMTRNSLTPPQAEDLVAHCGQRVMDSLVTMVGIQGLVPT